MRAKEQTFIWASFLPRDHVRHRLPFVRLPLLRLIREGNKSHKRPENQHANNRLFLRYWHTTCLNISIGKVFSFC
jgi:hypothetical protein